MTIKTTIAVIKSITPAARKQKAYDKMIADSQAKIGPYVPTPYVAQIWA
ncbi:MAG: hypothetical protein ABIW84_02330 [Ilumatobacteraceae bacterium]